MGWSKIPVEERAERQATRLAKHEASIKRLNDHQQRRDAATDVQVADGVRTGLNAARAVITGLIFLWIIFFAFIAILVVPKAGVGAGIFFGLLIVPAMLYAKRSVRLLRQDDRRSGIQSVMHDVIVNKQENLDTEQGFSHPSRYVRD